MNHRRDMYEFKNVLQRPTHWPDTNELTRPDNGGLVAINVFFSEGVFTYFGPTIRAGGVPLSSEISPKEYLAYAELDHEAGGDHGKINALGNAKRALHLMIDTLLNYYGLLARNRRCDFSQKLKLLDSAGLISLSIFRKLNIERNVVEHEYRRPSSEKISDAIDVCHLLNLAVERLGQQIPYEGFVGIRETGQHALFRLDASVGVIELWGLLDPVVITDGPFGTDFVSPRLISGLDRTPPSDQLSLEPIKVVPLTMKNIEEWRPLISTIVDLREDKEFSPHVATHYQDGSYEVGFLVPVVNDALGRDIWEVLRDHCDYMIQKANSNAAARPASGEGIESIVKAFVSGVSN